MLHGLSDLEEVVAHCRDESSRAYIAEALAAYRVGAYRSCIVSVWVGIVYDVLAKFRELSEEGDTNAESEIAKFESIRQKQDIRGSQNYESSLLELIEGEQFQFVNKIERATLERVRDDRHKCAHPTFIEEGVIFQPTAELARLHLTSAVETLLSRPPLQGKRALSKIQNLVISSHFPVDVFAAEAELRNSALGNARDSLIRNFLISCIKVCLRPDISELHFRKVVIAIEATRRIHHQKVHTMLQIDGGKLLTPDSDEQGAVVIQLLADLSWLEEYLSGVALERCRRLIIDEQNDWRYQNIPNAMRIESLKLAGQQALNEMQVGAFLGVADDIPTSLALDKTLYLLPTSTSYSESSAYAPLLDKYQDEIGSDHLDQILEAFVANNQVTYAHDMIGFLHRFLEKRPEMAQDANERLEEIAVLLESDSSSAARRLLRTISAQTAGGAAATMQNP